MCTETGRKNHVRCSLLCEFSSTACTSAVRGACRPHAPATVLGRLCHRTAHSTAARPMADSGAVLCAGLGAGWPENSSGNFCVSRTKKACRSPQTSFLSGRPAHVPSPRRWPAWFHWRRMPALPKDCHEPGSCWQLSERESQCDTAAAWKATLQELSLSSGSSPNWLCLKPHANRYQCHVCLVYWGRGPMKCSKPPRGQSSLTMKVL